MRACLCVLLLSCCHASWAYDEARLIGLAREAVTREVKHQAPPQARGSEGARPVFVTIEKRGRILGCRGALQAREGSLEGEVILAARAAAQHDPRYAPLAPADLKDFLVTVTIVQGMTPLSVAQVGTLEPQDGLVLQSGAKFGIVLPWEGRAPRVRLDWAYRKAGVTKGAACRLFRLKAVRFRG